MIAPLPGQVTSFLRDDQGGHPFLAVRPIVGDGLIGAEKIFSDLKPIHPGYQMLAGDFQTIGCYPDMLENNAPGDIQSPSVGVLFI